MLALSVVIADDHQLVRNGLKQLLAQHNDRYRDAADPVVAALPRAAARSLDERHVGHRRAAPRAQPAPLGRRAGRQWLPGAPVRHQRVARRRPRFHQQGGRRQGTAARDPHGGGPELADLLLGGETDGDELPRAPHMSLSDREFQIFCKLAEGRTVSEIAEKLFLSVKTISTYRSRILEKMSMMTNADLTSYALRHQLIP
jgi:DNA-binding NarL/FixJ family response regulator